MKTRSHLRGDPFVNLYEEFFRYRNIKYSVILSCGVYEFSGGIWYRCTMKKLDPHKFKSLECPVRVTDRKLIDKLTVAYMAGKFRRSKA